MDKRARELQGFMVSAGLEVGRIYQQGNRFHGVGIAPNGSEQVFSISNNTRSDMRGDLNEHARMKRFVRANPKVTPASTVVQEALWSAKTTLSLKPQSPEPSPADASETPPPAPAMTTQPQKQTRHLTQIEFYLLCEWLKASDVKDAPTYQSIAERATRSLTLDVSASTVRDAFAATSVPLPDKLKPVPLEPNVLLARELANFMTKLGETPTAELLALAKKANPEPA